MCIRERRGRLVRACDIWLVNDSREIFRSLVCACVCVWGGGIVVV